MGLTASLVGVTGTWWERGRKCDKALFTGQEMKKGVEMDWM